MNHQFNFFSNSGRNSCTLVLQFGCVWNLVQSCKSLLLFLATVLQYQTTPPPHKSTHPFWVPRTALVCLFLCLHASDGYGSRHQVVWLSVQFFETRHLGNTLKEFLWICLNHSPGPKDEVIRSWWSGAKSQGHCDPLSTFFLVNCDFVLVFFP